MEINDDIISNNSDETIKRNTLKLVKQIIEIVNMPDKKYLKINKGEANSFFDGQYYSFGCDELTKESVQDPYLISKGDEYNNKGYYLLHHTNYIIDSNMLLNLLNQMGISIKSANYVDIEDGEKTLPNTQSYRVDRFESKKNFTEVNIDETKTL